MSRASFAWLALLAGCPDSTKSDTGTPADTDADADTDTDTDTDADADSDSDADADSDSDADTDLGEDYLFDADHVLLMPTGYGLEAMDATGAIVYSASWSALVGTCSQCGGEGASIDGDGLLVSFTLNGPTGSGGVARLDAAGALEFRVDGFGFPHDAVRDPADDTVIIPEVEGGHMTWIAGDGSSGATVRDLDDEPDWPGASPNGISRFDWNGRSLLLSSH
ncbi:MAG: hypothetical protein ABMA64_32620, partial [Myxococcota bacterium]